MPTNDRPAISVSLPVAKNGPDRPQHSSLVPGFDRGFRQDDVGLEFLGHSSAMTLNDPFACVLSNARRNW